jgi:hypothetical protein
MLGVGLGTVNRDLGVPSGTVPNRLSRDHGGLPDTSVPYGTDDADPEIDAEEVDSSDPETYLVSRETGAG